MTARVSLQVTMVDRGRTMIPSTTILLKLPVCYSNSISMTECFVAGLKYSGNVFGGFSSFAWQRGTLQLIAINLIALFITFGSIFKLPSYKLRQQTLWKLIFVSFSKCLATTVHTTSIGPTNQCSRTLANRAICIVSCHPPPANPSFTLLVLSVHHLCIVTLTISTCTYYLNKPD